MSLLLSKTNTPTYDYLSQSTGLNPVAAAATLDNTNSPPTKQVVQTIYLVATIYAYTLIEIDIQNEVDSGVNLELSLDNVTFYEDLTGAGSGVTPGDMDASGGNQVIPVYVRFSGDNDGTLATGTYTAADIRVTALES